MAKAKIEIYRIKNLETGLYYTGGIYGPFKNEEYEKVEIKRISARDYANNHWTAQEKREKDYWNGKWPWNFYYKPKWNEVGKIFTNLRGAEKALSELTGTSIYTRKNPTKNILFGNKKSNNYVIVRCRILDRKAKNV